MSKETTAANKAARIARDAKAKERAAMRALDRALASPNRTGETIDRALRKARAAPTTSTGIPNFLRHAGH